MIGTLGMRRFAMALAASLLLAAPAAGQTITAEARPIDKPAWSKGILPISPESYWNAVECGKQGGQNPACVFWDTGLCKNDDFALALFTPYKMVAYEVWRVVSQKQPAPTPSYPEAQRTHITIGVTPVRGSKNVFKSLTLKRAGKPVTPIDRSLDAGGGRFTFDYAPFAPTADLALDLVGATATVSCAIPQPVLAQFR